MNSKTITLVIEEGALEYVAPLPGDRVTQSVDSSTGEEWEGEIVRIERDVPAPPTTSTPREVLAEQLFLKRLEVAGLPSKPFAAQSPRYREEWAQMADYVHYLNEAPTADQWVEWLLRLPVGTVVEDADGDRARKTPEELWEDTFGTHQDSQRLTGWSLPLTLPEGQDFPW